MRIILVIFLLFGCAANHQVVPLHGAPEVEFEVEDFNVRYDIIESGDTIKVSGVCVFKEDKIPEGSKTAIVKLTLHALDRYHTRLDSVTLGHDMPSLVYTPLVWEVFIPNTEPYQYILFDYSIAYQ